MAEVLTSEEMRAHETAAIESGSVTGLELMERAGQGVVDAVLRRWPEMRSDPSNVVVLCGPGNNGGDGFVIARLLQGLGWATRVILFGQIERLPPDAGRNCLRWQDIGEIIPAEKAVLGEAETPDLIIDALFGIGLTRLIGAPLDRLVEQVNDLKGKDAVRVVAVDIPSGICADSGRPLGPWVHADVAVTFHCRKPGHILLGGRDRQTRHIEVCDIGLPPRQRGVQEPEVILENEKPKPAALTKRGKAHKYSHGHAVVVCGPPGHSGAARLAARGALRIGAGLVTLAVRPGALAEVAAHETAVMLKEIGNADDLTNSLRADDRMNAICIGPALGTDGPALDLLKGALALGRPTVLDADALTLLAQIPETFSALHDGCVLTPHGGEFARLFPDIADRLASPPDRGPAYSKIDATRAAAARVGCVVLYKGADTVIADPEGRCVVNPPDDEAAWLATAGSGDALAGFICGLLARGHVPFDAASIAAYLHTACARHVGPGLIAEDLPESLPQVFRTLGV